MRKQFLKCATAFLLTVSLLLPVFPLFVGAEEKDTSQSIEGSASAIENVDITPTPAAPTTEGEAPVGAVGGTQMANRDPSSPYYAGEIIYEDPDDPFAETYEYLDGSTTTIPDGVYSIESLAYEMFGMYNLYSLHEPYGDDFILQLWDFQWVIPVDVYDIYGSFKITKKPNTNYYIIRWMSNNRYGFTGEGGSLALKALPYNDADVSLADTFSITYSGGGFVIKPYGSSAAISIPATADPYVGPELALENPSTAGALARWNLILYTGPDYHGFFMNGDTAGLRDGICAGESHSIKIFGTSTDPYTNEPHPTINASTSSKATVSWNSTTQVASIFGRDDPLATLNIAVRNSSGAAACTFERDFYVNLPMHEGVFYLQNKELGNYMQIDNDDFFYGYQSEGAFMELYEYTGDDYQRWRFEHDIDGYYIISSVISGKVLTVPQGEENDSGEALTQNSDGFVDRQRWKFEKTARGSFIIRPKSGEGYNTDWCMSASTGIIWSDGRNVEQRAYTDDTDYKDEWLLTYCSDFAFVFWGHMVDDPAMTDVLNGVLPKYTDGGAKGWATLEALPTNQVLQQLNDAEIFAIITHGNDTTLLIQVAPEIVAIQLTIDQINALPNNALKNAKLVCLFVCETGKGGSSAVNLANAIYDKGAQAVISFKTSIHRGATNDWAKAFLINIGEKRSISAAITGANDYVNGLKSSYDPNTFNNESNPSLSQNQYFLGDLTAVPNE